jgi:hypothetical protein
MLLKVFAVAAAAGKREASEIYRGVKELYLLFVFLLRSFKSSFATFFLFRNPPNRFEPSRWREIVCETIKERRKKSSTDFSTCFNQVFPLLFKGIFITIP